MIKIKMFQPALLLAVLCLVVTLLLAATNELTKGPIAVQEEQKILEQMQAIFPSGDSFPVIELSDGQKTAMEEKDIAADKICEALDKDGGLLGYIFITSGQGYAGKVVATSGIGKDGKIIMVAAAAADDTPGLGQRVSERVFSDQFTGIDTSVQTSVTGEKGTTKIDGISGATISSKAASAAVNKAMGAYAYLREEGMIE